MVRHITKPVAPAGKDYDYHYDYSDMTDQDPLPFSDSTAADAVLAACGLREPAFADTGVGAFNDAFFFPSQQHLRALGFIGQLLWSRSNLAVITGEAGMGKSMLIRRLLSDLDERVLIAHVRAKSQDSQQDFLLSVLQQFGIQLEPTDRSDRRRLLHRFLAHQYGMNRLSLLVVEAVHTLRPAALDELREIAAMTTDGRRVVKLLLLGGASLQHVIDSPRMETLCVGRAPRLNLDPFSEDQVAAYVAHRLRAAGSQDADALVPPTLAMLIHRYTGGRPGLINRLCDQALRCAVQAGEGRLTAVALNEAGEHLELRPVGEAAAAVTTNEPSEARPPESEQALLILTVQGGPDGVIPLRTDRVLIGRGEGVDVRIESAFVSRYHALIVRETHRDVGAAAVAAQPDGVSRDLLIDLGSTNGVLVNGKRVIRHVLKHRDLIQVGPARITYLNPAVAPQMERDGSETLKFGRSFGAAGAADLENGIEQSILAFGRFDEAG